MLRKICAWTFLTLVALTAAAWPTTFTPSGDCTATTGATISSTKWNNCISSLQTGINAIDNDRVTATAAIVGSKLNLTSGTGRIVQTHTATGDAPILSSSQTWNNAAETFTGWALNVTDTASAAASKLLDLKVGGVSKFAVNKDGSTTPSGTPVGAIVSYAGISAPTGFVLGYGQTLSRTTYSSLYEAITIRTTATTSSGNAVVTGIPDTTGMVAAMPISGTGIPAATTILTVDSDTQITLSQAATASGTGVAIVVAPHGVGDGSTTFTVPDCRGRVIAGVDNMGGSAANRLTGVTGLAGARLGSSGGSTTILAANIPELTVTDPGHVHGDVEKTTGSSFNRYSAGTQYTSGSTASATTGIQVNAGGGTAGYAQPTLAMNCLVKAQ